MRDIGIFIIGCGVFGTALGATMVIHIGPSIPDVDEREMLKDVSLQETHREAG